MCKSKWHSPEKCNNYSVSFIIILSGGTWSYDPVTKTKGRTKKIALHDQTIICVERSSIWDRKYVSRAKRQHYDLIIVCLFIPNLLLHMVVWNPSSKNQNCQRITTRTVYFIGNFIRPLYYLLSIMQIVAIFKK